MTPRRDWLNAILMKASIFPVSAALFLACVPANAAVTLLAENFDGGGINSTFSLFNGSGAAPAVVNAGGVNQNVAQVTNLNGGNFNSVWWNYVPLGSGATRLTLSIDFRMTGDAANAGAGGCCGEAADGIGIGFYSTASYGTSGGNAVTGVWEQDGHAAAFKVGLDVFDGGGPNGNRVLLHNGTTQIGVNPTPGFVLNDDVFHRLTLTLDDAGANSLASVVLIRDINGAATPFPVLSGLPLTGVDLDNFAYRVAVGGRTGGAFTRSQIDNLSVSTVPEPGAAFGSLLAGAFAASVVLRRRRRVN